MSKPNVLVFGDSGTGKSSIVNLIIGYHKANVSDRAIGCTFEFQKYSTEHYNVFDTVGLSEGAKGSVKQSAAVTKLIDLLKSLEDGVSLLIFVIKKDRIKKSTDENYKLFAKAICMDKVPILLVITNCEMEIEEGMWWSENKRFFDDYEMKFSDVISGCSMQWETALPLIRPHIKTRYDSTKIQLCEKITDNLLQSPWKMEGGWMKWLRSILKSVLPFLKLWFISDIGRRVYAFFIQIGYDPNTAVEIAEDLSDHF